MATPFMRKFLIVLLLVIVTLSILWIFGAKEISAVADQFQTRAIESAPVQSISYEGSGEGGTLILDNERFTLNSLKPHVGSSKDNELALASGGKVFAFGALRSTESDSLNANVPSEDSASLARKQSFIPWPTLDGGKPRLNYRNYRELDWKKSSGAKLIMLWSLDPADANSINLIRVEISGVSR